jgi:hypothetical protein
LAQRFTLVLERYKLRFKYVKRAGNTSSGRREIRTASNVRHAAPTSADEKFLGTALLLDVTK